MERVRRAREPLPVLDQDASACQVCKPLTVGVKSATSSQLPLSINSHPRAIFELLQC